MKVLHVIPAVAPRYGGPSTVVAAASRALIDAGHDVTIATTDADGPGRLPVRPGRSDLWEGVPAIFFRRSLTEAFKWSPGLGAWLASHVSDYDVVDVHAVFSHSSVAAGQACRRLGVPYVVRPHGTLDPWSLRRKSLQKKVLMRLGARRLLSGAALMQYTTAEELRLAEQSLPWLPAGCVVPLGVAEECFGEDLLPPAEHPYVLVMSRLEQKKGLELLIEAFHQVAGDPALSRWRLVIAGDGDPRYVGALKAAAAQGAARSRIRFAGWISGPKKLELVRRASLFASPSEQENFGLSLVEALAAGVPALISPGVNLAPEVSAAGAGWILERQPESFASALAAMLKDPDELRARGRRGRLLANHYRWPASAAALAALYCRARQPGVAAGG